MNGIIIYGMMASGFAYLTWRFRANSLDRILFGAAAFSLLVPIIVQVVYLYVSKSLAGYGILLSAGAGWLGYLIGLALAVRAVFISGDKLARWAAAGGCLILFVTPIGLIMAFLLIIGMAK